MFKKNCELPSTMSKIQTSKYKSKDATKSINKQKAKHKDKGKSKARSESKSKTRSKSKSNKTSKTSKASKNKSKSRDKSRPKNISKSDDEAGVNSKSGSFDKAGTKNKPKPNDKADAKTKSKSQYNSSAKNESHAKNQSGPDDKKVTISMLLAAYKLYEIVKPSAITSESFRITTKGRAIWTDPLYHMFQAINQRCIQATTSIKVQFLQKQIGEYDEGLMKELRAKQSRDDKSESLRRLKIVYYNIVFDDVFRSKVSNLFGQHSYMHEAIMTRGTVHSLCTEKMFMYPGDKCIECKGTLQKSFTAIRRDHQGTFGIAYHRKSGPSSCTSYRKKCPNCHIDYYQNRIDYRSDTKCAGKANRTIWLDPEAFDYFTMHQGGQAMLAQSIFRSIKNHQYCNKSSSLQIWLKHFNEDWHEEYARLDKYMFSLPSSQLGYQVLLRNFYFHSLLCRLRDNEEIKFEPSSITINDQSVKVALVLTDADKKEAYKQHQAIAQAIKERNNANDSNHNNSNNHHNANDKTQPDQKDQKYRPKYLEFVVNKYYLQLKNAEIPELKTVPVKRNAKRKIEIYPGWFIVYGDGGEKLSRLRCAYPSFLAKLDVYKHEESSKTAKKRNNKTTENEAKSESESLGVDEDEIECEDNDGAIDLKQFNNARLYSMKRYYECDLTPARQSATNDHDSIAYKCCKIHTARLIRTYNFAPEDIPLFVTWHQLHTAIARLSNQSFTASILEVYSVDPEILDKLTTKRKKKLAELEYKSTEWRQKHGGKHRQFTEFYDTIRAQVLSYEKGMSSQESKKPRARRRSAIASIPLTKQCVESDNAEDLAEDLEETCGDTDVDTRPLKLLENKLREEITGEVQDNKKLASYNGCRKAGYFSKATTARTKGLNVLMNTSGMILGLREEVVRETPTGVLLDITDVFIKNAAAIEYANRIEAIGYDFMCRLYYTLRTKARDELLSEKQMAFWYDVIWRAFIDIWHVTTHTDDLCNLKKGIFHPFLAKFEEILFDINDMMKRCNDIIAEQFWSTMNASCQLKSMSRETMFLFLLEKRSYYNRVKLQSIIDDGYTLIPIEYCTTLRDVKAKPPTFPKEEELVKARTHKLKKVTIKPDKIEEVKRLIEADDKNNNNNKNKRKVSGNKRKLSSSKSPQNAPKSKKQKFN